MKSPTRVVALAAVSVLALTTACGGSSNPKPSPTPTSTPATSSAPASTSAAASTSAPPPAPVNPLTGLAPVPSGPVVAVKIDDTSGGRPMRNIDLADVV